MQRFLAEGEALQQVAVMGLRAPDGSVAENVPLYRIIPAKEIKPESGLTASEEETCKDFGKSIADIFKQYKREERKAKAIVILREECREAVRHLPPERRREPEIAALIQQIAI